MKEGAARDPRNDYGEDEDLHVLITGDSQTDVCPLPSWTAHMRHQHPKRISNALHCPTQVTCTWSGAQLRSLGELGYRQFRRQMIDRSPCMAASPMGLCRISGLGRMN